MWKDLGRASVPQLLTASRVVFAAAAIISAIKGNLYLSATLITLGTVTDAADGFVSRRLGVSSLFGALFDYFADYLCFVIAPWILVRALCGPNRSLIFEVSIGLPLVFGAVRYARNSLLVTAETTDVRELPGLATIFFAFLPVAAIFLDAAAFVGQRILTLTLVVFVVGFSLLMVVPVRYPKLTKVPGLSPAVLVLLVLMPFLWTRLIAAAMVVLGSLYVVLAPLSIRRRRFRASRFFNSRSEVAGDESELLT